MSEPQITSNRFNPLRNVSLISMNYVAEVMKERKVQMPHCSSWRYTVTLAKIRSGAVAVESRNGGERQFPSGASRFYFLDSPHLVSYHLLVGIEFSVSLLLYYFTENCN